MSPEIKYRQFTNEDDDIWATLQKINGDDKVTVLKKIHYEFWLRNAMQVEMARQITVGKILSENGIEINTGKLPMPSDSDGYYRYEDWVKKYPDGKPFIFADNEAISKDGSTYKYFFMPEQEGRGWGLLLKKTENKIEVLAEDHLDNMLEPLMQLARNFGIDIETKYMSETRLLHGPGPRPEEF